MCHFCPVEVKNMGLGAGWEEWIFLVLLLVLFFCFTHWQQYTGKVKYGFCKTMPNENMKKHNWFRIQHPDIFQSRTKQNKNQYDLRFELGKPCIPKDLSKDI